MSNEKWAFSHVLLLLKSLSYGEMSPNLIFLVYKGTSTSETQLVSSTQMVVCRFL